VGQTLGPSNDIIRNLLRERINRTLRMPRHKQRETRSVNDSQSLNPENTSLGVDDSHWIARSAHFTWKIVLASQHQKNGLLKM
jgi:hypothetical protein